MPLWLERTRHPPSKRIYAGSNPASGTPLETPTFLARDQWGLACTVLPRCSINADTVSGSNPDTLTVACVSGIGRSRALSSVVERQVVNLVCAGSNPVGLA